MKKPQTQRILEALRDRGWINGRWFNNEMMISQYHTRIHELQKQGHEIEASTFVDDYGFKSYRLIKEYKPSRVKPLSEPSRLPGRKGPGLYRSQS